MTGKTIAGSSRTILDANLVNHLAHKADQASTRMSKAIIAHHEAQVNVQDLEIAARQAAASYQDYQQAGRKPAWGRKNINHGRENGVLKTKQLKLMACYNRLRLAHTEATLVLSLTGRESSKAYADATQAKQAHSEFLRGLQKKERRRRAWRWLRSVLMM